jgi:hypothetical protein
MGYGQCVLASYPCGTPAVFGCGASTYDLAHSSTSCAPADGGALTLAECSLVCPATFSSILSCNVYDDGTGGHISCSYGPCVTGRRPEGLLRPASSGALDACGEYLATTAYLEAASVVAFDHLTRELAAHGAPARLQAASRRAARDEQRHARVTGALARRAGARVAPVEDAPRAVRSLLDMAIENAAEGCVRETFGAAVGMVQARRASDPGVCQAMGRISRDEVRHAELSWAVAEWLETRLSAEERAQVHEARTRAADALFAELATEPDGDLARRLGLPSAVEARAILDRLRASLWSTRAAAA